MNYINGANLLPSTGVSQQYKLLGVLDQGSSGSVTFTRLLTKVDGIGDDEKVTAYPAVAGDVVFFTTTTFRPAGSAWRATTAANAASSSSSPRVGS